MPVWQNAFALFKKRSHVLHPRCNLVHVNSGTFRDFSGGSVQFVPVEVVTMGGFRSFSNISEVTGIKHAQQNYIPDITVIRRDLFYPASSYGEVKDACGQRLDEVL